MIDEEIISSEDDFSEFGEDTGLIYGIILKSILNATMLSRPIGMLWDDDYIKEFLIAKGYKIIDRIDKESGDVYSVPVKIGSSTIPDEQDALRRIFDREIQKTLLKWLIKIDSEL